MRIVAQRGFFVVALSPIPDTPICPRGSHATHACFHHISNQLVPNIRGRDYAHTLRSLGFTRATFSDMQVLSDVGYGFMSSV